MRTFALLVICIVLAGCSGGAKETEDVLDDAPGSIHVSVLSHNDLPVKNARVSVLGTEFFGDTRTDGTIHFDGLPPGTHEVNVQASSFLPAKEKVEVIAAAQSNVTLQLALDPSQPENPHIHDLWRGQPTYTMMDSTIDITKYPPNQTPFTPVEEPLGGMFTRPNGVASDDTFFIPLVDDDVDAVIVLPGTKTMTITVEWDSAKVGFDQMGIEYNPPNGNAQKTEMFSSGAPVTIEVDKAWWDDGHRTFSRWILRGFHNNQPDQPTSWTPVVVTDGKIGVRIELERGELEVDAAHPDLWKGKTELVLRESGDPRAGAPLGAGRRGTEGGLRLDDEQIVPPDTRILRIEFSWNHNQANDVEREDYDLTWRTAAQNPQTTDITEFERATAIEGSAAQKYKVYEIEIGEGEGDSVYDTSTAWRFVPWMNRLPEDGYRVSGTTFFDMVVTAYK